eukprot:s275_g17.t1
MHVRRQPRTERCPSSGLPRAAPHSDIKITCAGVTIFWKKAATLRKISRMASASAASPARCRPPNARGIGRCSRSLALNVAAGEGALAPGTRNSDTRLNWDRREMGSACPLLAVRPGLLPSLVSWTNEDAQPSPSRPSRSIAVDEALCAKKNTESHASTRH